MKHFICQQCGSEQNVQQNVCQIQWVSKSFFAENSRGQNKMFDTSRQEIFVQSGITVKHILPNVLFTGKVSTWHWCQAQKYNCSSWIVCTSEYSCFVEQSNTNVAKGDIHKRNLMFKEPFEENKTCRHIQICHSRLAHLLHFKTSHVSQTQRRRIISTCREVDQHKD